MKAAVLSEINTFPEIKEIQKPHPGEGEVSIKVHYSGLNHRDVWITKGMYAGISLPLVLGSDGAGEWEGEKVLINPSLNWGNNVHVQAVDYKILGLPDQGTFAEHIVVPRDKVHPIPVHLEMDEAAALPLAGLTAFRALVSKCQPQPGEKVLISGVGGGVALFAMQFAVALGCEVYVTSGADEKIEKAIVLGAKGGANYKKDAFTKELKSMAGGFDVIIDSAAGDGFADLIKLCNPGARVCFYGGTRGLINKLNPQIIFWKQISIFGSTMGTDDEFTAMLELVSKHSIRPVIDKVFSLEDVALAFERMNNGLQFGKILIKNS